MSVRWKVAVAAGVVALGAALLVGPVLGTSAQAADTRDEPDPAACLDEQEAKFLELINDYRAENDVEPLKASKTLNVASYGHSKDMADNDYFDHESQDGRQPEDRMEEAGYEGSTTGENIAAGYPTAEEAFDVWRNSEGHNENMLDEDFAVIGIGLAENDDSEYGEYWTTDFGGEVDAAPECGKPERSR
jgi:uncharacterized protein YkwD